MAFAPVFGRPFAATFDRHAAAVVPPAGNWYDGLTVAYQPKGAASYAASKINLANPGTYDAGDGAAYPTWASGTGWTFNGIDQYLTTGVSTTNASWTMLVLFSGAPTSGLSALCGYRDAFSTRFLLWSSLFGSAAYENNQDMSASPGLDAGVLAVAAQIGYRDGVEDVVGGAPYSTGASTNTVYVGCANNAGTASWFTSASIQAVAIKSSTLTPTEIATLSAAMAAL